jgi:MFS family permease
MPSDTVAASPWRRDAMLVALVGGAHSISHFSQLLLAPLFPWLKDAFGVGFAELGFLLTIFFVVSCVIQTLSGFWVDRFGPRPVLLTGLTLIGFAALGYAMSTSYAMLAAFSVVAGVGNGVFHPVDYTLINRKVAKEHLGHAYSVHGITGSLGWALAPAILVPLTVAFSWRVALASAAVLVFAVLAMLVIFRRHLELEPLPPSPKVAEGGLAVEGTLDFLRIPAVWMCFGFFFFYAGALSVIQSFAPAAAGRLHGVPTELAAMCLTVYMVCSAGGMLAGGFLASNHERSERIVGLGFGVAASVALVLGYATLPVIAVPVLFGVMGFVTGTAGPSRDIIVKRAAPDNATGRVYGVVYSGLDIGQAVVPLVIGHMMDLHQYRSVWLVLAILQGVLILTAFSVRRVRRTVGVPAAA